MSPSILSRARLGLAVLGAALAPALAACGSERAVSPTAPVAPRPAVVDAGTSTTVLTRTSPLPRDVVASADIGPSGGSLRIGEAGLTLTVPRGAVRETVRFTATARAGSLVAYEMGPHMTFARPVVITQSLKGTNFFRVADRGAVAGAYVADMGTLDEVAATAVADELLPVAVDLGTSKLRFGVAHFSGYVIATGAKGGK